MKDLLVVSAVDFEVRPLCRRLDARGVVYHTAQTGIGSLAAAASARDVALSAQGRHVVFVGTAGTFGTFDKPFLCTAARVCWLPSGERAGISYGIPQGKLHSLLLDPEKSLSLPAMTVICSPSISINSDFAPQWKKQLDPPHCVENLELWSCVGALMASARRLDIVLGVTNQTGAQAHEQWVKWHESAAEMAAEHVEKFICEN